MDTALATLIVSTSGPVITSVFGMFFMANQVGKRLDDWNKRREDRSNRLGKRIDDSRTDVKDSRSEF
jgi:hypothetical protein